MPRPKTIERYPQSYFDLFERAYQHPLSIPTSSYSAAANLRSELYTFRRVLRESVLGGQIKPRIALMADDLQFKITGSTLIVERRPLARGRLVEKMLERQEMKLQDENKPVHTGDDIEIKEQTDDITDDLSAAHG